MRSLLAAALFIAVAVFIAVTEPAPTSAQEKKSNKQKTKSKFAPPKAAKPNDATLTTIAEKTGELRTAVAKLRARKIPDDVLIEVEIYLKAAENIVRFAEWYSANSGKWALTTLDLGLARARQAEGGKAVWRETPGKWVLRAYRSQVDRSIQPYAVLLPVEYGKDPKKKWRLDVVLHGRDSSLTEAKFIATHQGTAPKDRNYIQLEPYGRGNNAYRWSGESDVFEAMRAFQSARTVDPFRIVLRGFSMGGAGTWHIGLHHPSEFCVIGPGAGFTTTHGYVPNLPKELPDYQEKCLRIYDAYRYAENAFNVPVVAYSGEIDPQKKAADNIETTLKKFKESVKFTHLVAPGLAHQMPKAWQEKAETEYRKYAEKGNNWDRERIRFVTYTPKYAWCQWLVVEALDETYQKAVVDVTHTKGRFVVRTTNVRRLKLFPNDGLTEAVTIDGQKVKLNKSNPATISLEKIDGKWGERKDSRLVIIEKDSRCPGPIDDAFSRIFKVVRPSTEGFSTAGDKFADASVTQFSALWDRYFRGKLPSMKANEYDTTDATVVLFGDPQSNPLIAKLLPKLPITWTKEKLVVNGVEYDSKTHLPVLIYPNPTNPSHYIVINSGHTFKEADLRGTNALLYPRLGDWAIIKPAPTAKDPAAYEVAAAGLFDEKWQFPRKK